MDYEKAASIRKKGLAGLITENLVEGQGITSSFGSAISDRTKATITGIQEKFDPINIVKALTGGSNLAAAIVGRLTGRSQPTLKYFAGKRKPISAKGINFETGESLTNPVTEALGLIYEELRLAEEDRKLINQTKREQEAEQERQEDRRNQAIIEAITARRKPEETPKEKATKRKKQIKRKTKEKKVEQDTAKKETKTKAENKQQKQESKKESTKKESVEKKKETVQKVEEKKVEVKPKVEKAPEVKPEVKPKVERVPEVKPTKPPTAGKIISGAVATAAILTGKEALAANIAKYESGKAGYNAYNKGTIGNRMIPSDKPIDFSKMTISDYLKRGSLPVGDPDRLFAVGRYQIIPKTMESLVEKLKIDPTKTYLDPPTQDLLFSQGLTKTLRKKVDDYVTGKSDDKNAAILQLAQEFASVGIPYDMKVGNKQLKKGDSYYSGIGGNKAHNSPEEVGAALDSDRKKYLANKQKTTDSPVPDLNTGSRISESSIENKDLKKDLNNTNIKPAIINNTNVNQTNTVTPTKKQKENDRPAILEKSRG